MNRTKISKYKIIHKQNQKINYSNQNNLTFLKLNKLSNQLKYFLINLQR